MTIYLLGDSQLDKLSIANLLAQRTGWNMSDTASDDDNMIICTEEEPPAEKTNTLTVFLYSSGTTSEQELLALDDKHDIQIDAATVDAATISEIIVNLLV